MGSKGTQHNRQHGTECCTTQYNFNHNFTHGRTNRLAKVIIHLNITVTKTSELSSLFNLQFYILPALFTTHSKGCVSAISHTPRLLYIHPYVKLKALVSQRTNKHREKENCGFAKKINIHHFWTINPN